VFVNLGIKVVDGTKGTDTWSLVNPEDLRRDLENRRMERVAKEKAKLENKKTVVEKDIAKWTRYAQGKSEREVVFGDYSVFDEEGLPVDPEMSASKRKAFKKDVEKFRKENADFVARGGMELMQQLRDELAKLEAQINAME
jgi:hypothetical protein